MNIINGGAFSSDAGIGSPNAARLLGHLQQVSGARPALWMVDRELEYPGIGRVFGCSSEHAALLSAAVADPQMLITWHTIFIAIALFIVGRGLKNGIERVVTVLMPALFGMLLLMIGYAAVEGDFGAALSFLFSTDGSTGMGR